MLPYRPKQTDSRPSLSQEDNLRYRSSSKRHQPQERSLNNRPSPSYHPVLNETPTQETKNPPSLKYLLDYPPGLIIHTLSTLDRHHPPSFLTHIFTISKATSTSQIAFLEASEKIIEGYMNRRGDFDAVPNNYRKYYVKELARKVILEAVNERSGMKNGGLELVNGGWGRFSR